MPRFVAPLDLSNYELLNARLQNLGTAPGTILSGLIYINTGDGNVYVGNSAGNSFLRLNNLSGSELITLFNSNDGAGSGTDADKLDGQEGTYYASRANHTGTQTASTISDFDAQVRTNRLDQMAAPTAAVDFNTQEITNIATPSSGTSAVNRNYVDAVMTGNPWRDAVRTASSANVNTASPGATIGGVTLTNGDRVLLRAQTNGTQNGYWLWNGASTAMTRTTDADSSADLKPGIAVLVQEGDWADTQWVLSTDAPITLGTTALTFIQIGSATSYAAGTGLTLTGNTFSIDTGYTGQTSITTVGVITTGTWSADTITVAKGGTGATTAKGARDNLNAAGIYTALIGNGTDSSYSITQATHGLSNSGKIQVATYDASTGERIYPNEYVDNSNGTVTIEAGGPVGTNEYRVVIQG